MKTGKKIWCILLALVLVLGMAAPAAYAETTDGEITIESVTAAPVTFVEGAYNGTATDDEGNEIGVYRPLNKDVIFTITYSDGNFVECQWYEFTDQLDHLTEIEDTNGWTVGEHIFQVQAGDIIIDIPVFIVENPVESVTVAPFTVYEGIHQYETTYWDAETESQKECLVFDLWDLEFQLDITFTDGSSKTVSRYDLYGYNLDFDIDMDTLETRDWTVGNTYQVPITVSGRECTAGVTVAQNPVAGITAEPVTVYESIHQHQTTYWDDETQSEKEGLLFYPWDIDFRVNVTFADGTVKTLDREGAHAYGLEFSIPMSDWETKDWAAGNTYQVPLEISGRACSVPVTVAPNPVASVRVADISMKASDAWDGYYTFNEHLRFEITKADGTVHTLRLYELYDHDVYPDIYDPQYEEPFVPGQTYTVEYSVLGHEGQFQVEIIDDRIKTMTAEAQYSLYELLSSGVANLESTDPIVTVTRNDGTSATFPYSQRWNYIQSDMMLELAEIPESGYLAAGEYKAAVTLEGVAAEFTVTVLENPVESFTVSTKYPFVMNAEGYYSYDAVPYSVTLKLKDGTSKTYADVTCLWEDYRTYDYIPYLITDSEAPLTAGVHKAEAVLMGMVCEQTVTIADPGITKITGSYDGVLIENISGWLTGDVDENGEWVEFFYYTTNDDLFRFTVTYADGTEQTLGIFDTIMGSYVSSMLYGDDTQSAQNPWKVGKNKITCSMLGHEFEIEVEVVANTIQDVAVKATEPLYQGWHVVEAYDDETYLNVRYSYPEITLTYTDGTTKTYAYEELANEFNQVGLSSVDGTSTGTKTATLWFADKEYSFQVQVKENPVKTVTVAPSKSLTESKDGWYEIKDTVPVYTVAYTDGTTDTLYGNDQLTEKFGLYPSWTEPEKFVVGKNTVDVTVFGHTAKYTFEIVKAANPLTKITAKAVAPLYMSSDPYYGSYDYTALVEVTLTYADGSTKTVMANDLRNAQGALQIYFIDDQYSVQWGVGKHAVTAEYMGLEAEFTVEVAENPYVKLSISADNGLTVTLEKQDGTKEVLTARSFQVDSAAKTGTIGNLVTDKGSMFVVFYYDDQVQENIAYMEYNGMRSNALEGCKWLSQQLALQGAGNVAIDKTAQELIDLVDKNAYRVWFTATELEANDISAADTAKIEAAVPDGYKSAAALDLNLYKESDYGTYQISQVSEKISITVAVPGELADLGTLLAGFKVIRLHNGTADVLDVVYNKETFTITFQTDKFSSYTVVYSTHELTKAAAKDASCTADGNGEYYTCSHCGKLFADEKAKTEVTADAVTVKAGHKLEKVEAKAATTQAAGLKEHHKCSVCGKLFADAEGKTETTEAEITVAKLKPDTGSNPATGDETPLVLLAVLMSVSALLAAGAFLSRKKFH